MRDRDADELRREIGYVIQQIGLFPHRTIADNIATVPRCSAGTSSGSRRASTELLDLIGLPQEMADALPRAALRRPAPARRRRPRARRRPAADADGRAVRRDRPDQPRAPAERVPAPAGRGPQDDRLRHPRHRRGDQDGRPHRGPAGRRQARPVRAARRSCCCTPANAFVEDFVGADRALKRSRCGACATSTCGACDGEGRRAVAEVGAGSRTPTSRSRCWSTTTAAARLAGERALTGERVREQLRSGPSRSSSSTTSCATRSRTCSPTAPSTAGGRRDGKAVGVLSMELLIASRDAACEIRAAQVGERSTDRPASSDNGFCPELDRRQPRPLQDAADRAHRADADRGRDRLRDRLRARAARPPPPLADPADHAGHRDPLHAAERRGLLPAAAADRPRQRRPR